MKNLESRFYSRTPVAQTLVFAESRRLLTLVWVPMQARLDKRGRDVCGKEPNGGFSGDFGTKKPGINGE